MSDLKTQENQRELFSHFASEPPAVERAPLIAKTQKPILISTTMEQLLLAGIVFILVFCLVFFLGVLRGRATKSSVILQTAAAPLRQAPLPVKTAPLPVRPVVAVPAPVAAVTAKPYTIQVLTTKNKDYAENEAGLLKNSGFAGLASQSGSYYVVCVGSYMGKEDAKKDLSRLAARYKSAYLRRR